MSKFEIFTETTFTAKVRGVAFPVSLDKLPVAGLAKIFEYGVQRILNDAAASAKTDAEATALAQKRWDNLCNGVIRATPQREGNPVRARAIELASARVRVNPKFIAWLAEAKLKPSDKAAVAKVRELAIAAVEKPDNAFMVQAAIDVAAAKALTLDDFDLEGLTDADDNLDNEGNPIPDDDA